MQNRAPIVSLNMGDYDSAAVSDELSEVYGIQTRSGAHCAPLMHQTFHTEEQGMVRFSFFALCDGRADKGNHLGTSGNGRRKCIETKRIAGHSDI